MQPGSNVRPQASVVQLVVHLTANPGFASLNPNSAT